MLRQIKKYYLVGIIIAGLWGCEDDTNISEVSITEVLKVTYSPSGCCSNFTLPQEIKVSTPNFDYETKFLDAINIEEIENDFDLVIADELNVQFKVLENPLPCPTFCLFEKQPIPIEIISVEKL